MTTLKWIGVAIVFAGTVGLFVAGSAWAGVLIPTGAAIAFYAQRQESR